MKSKPIIDRVMEKISPEPNSGCWLWLNSLTNGYAQIYAGKRNGRSYSVRAHRVTYEHFKSPIPDGLELDHKCRITSCVNPDHLEAVTHKANINRGNTKAMGEFNRVKTHCVQGHPLSGDNLYINAKAERGCIACRRVASRRHYEKIKDRK